ncbi:hypothetical protein BABA_05481 [Neobacillus bataviensis LMG 21833]|uniref:DUF3231 family protein n=1 Tax=Neobacillus bataviensis LMG 21833 TaxID=1117379 RepID=K6DD57_9BACI|nr:DUF3231 family protein [Neobacillus bataviensis]EKN70472.1 hypothetical protein BABA_05481 [Neobacillus bataviensis LMG 21833]
MNKKVENVQLTSAEISVLWSTYFSDSMVVCIMTHFIDTHLDPEILPILEKTIHIAKKHMNEVEQLFLKEKIAVPEAFKVEKHVVPNAPKLFSDMFYMQYVLHMCRFGILSHSAGFTISAREDVRKMYKDFMDEASQLFNDVVDSMQEKGTFVRMPFMTYPSESDFIEKEKFMTGWFGRRRSLLAIEVTHLVMNAFQNELGRATCVGFSQVAQDQEIRDYFLRGKHQCKHILNSIHDVLVESDVPNAMTWDNSATNSTVAPFSDQLMLFVMAALSNLGMLTYGSGLSVTMRRDISAMYANFIIKAGAFGEDGLNLMIERRWMEQPPHFEDRDRLAKKEK